MQSAKMSDADKGEIAMEEVDFLIGSILCFVILASYVPQHVECIQLRSAQGLSLWTILLSSISCSFAFLSTLLSDYHTILNKGTTHHDFDSANRSTSFLVHILFIANACMPTIQNSITIVAGTPTYAFYYFYYTQQLQQNENSERRDQPSTSGHGKKHRFEVTVTVITWLVVALAVSGSVWVLIINGPTSNVVTALAKFWGAASAVTNTVQWIPQIDATWMAQHEGILSIWSLIISVLSDILVATYWAFGPGESFWVYLSNATDATLQVALIGMICYFRIRRRRIAVNDHRYDQSVDSLSRPLLLTSTNANETIRRENETTVFEHSEIEH
jgi:PQ loop repeat